MNGFQFRQGRPSRMMSRSLALGGMKKAVPRNSCTRDSKGGRSAVQTDSSGLNREKPAQPLTPRKDPPDRMDYAEMSMTPQSPASEPKARRRSCLVPHHRRYRALAGTAQQHFLAVGEARGKHHAVLVADRGDVVARDGRPRR